METVKELKAKVAALESQVAAKQAEVETLKAENIALKEARPEDVKQLHELIDALKERVAELELQKVEQKKNSTAQVFSYNGKKYCFNTQGVILPSTRISDAEGKQGDFKFGKYAGKRVTQEDVLSNPELLDLIMSNGLGFVREIKEEGGN